MDFLIFRIANSLNILVYKFGKIYFFLIAFSWRIGFRKCVSKNLSENFQGWRIDCSHSLNFPHIFFFLVRLQAQLFILIKKRICFFFWNAQQNCWNHNRLWSSQLYFYLPERFCMLVYLNVRVFISCSTVIITQELFMW